jgi:transcriptional regulator with XRE-family HTH domain
MPTTEAQLEFASRLYAGACAAGLNQASLRQAAGIARARMSAMYRGLVEPTREEVQVLALALGVSEDSLWRFPPLVPSVTSDPHEQRAAAFAERLRARMRERNLNQAGLSRLSSIKRDSISIHCCGRSIPRSRHLLKLASALECEPSALLPEVQSAIAAESPINIQQIGPDRFLLAAHAVIDAATASRLLAALAPPQPG